ncbi:cobyrinate a,c-diamide synthase [Dechloromonas denitrificans]|uniref:cobyrinate a,c-diamide synthase n=1 Tax=Dechloromonas denitrificans TaxID=281362 RepID=UPI001CF842C6|nr:cobyrinate a,c-diamide synthase [Dechloromonas denitrificans]UCV11535.1 cobyrinate a,c-diamide synthase [Dechloromonas denitrificans]
MTACPALLIAAPSSGQGKTTVTAALARLHARQGRRVTVFKCGPDFLDPQIHAVASGRPCQNLDLGMCGEEDARWRLSRAAQDSDLILVEGVMGLFDGTPSAADIACRFNIPVMAMIDAGAMAQTFGAVAHGLATYRPGLPFAGVLANRVGSERHAAMARDSLPAGMGWFGALPRNPDAVLPERHLGLLQAAEIDDIEERLDRLADALAASATVDLPKAVNFEDAPPPAIEPLLAGKRLAIARDAAYGFIYPANLETLADLGAELRFFSPVAGEPLPACDAVWLPGGYPELHAPALSANQPLWTALRAHVAAGKPLLAECGGMMSLFEQVTDKTGETHAFAGLLPGISVMQKRLAALGMQFADLPEGRLQGHTFHYSKSETPLTPIVRAQTQDGRDGEAIYRQQRLTASYVHFYFASNPKATAALFS